MKERIFLSSPHMGGEEKKYIDEAFATNWIAPLGKNVTEFEREMCSYIGRSSAIALSSGSAAIHLGLKYFGVGEGDVVFCSSFTFSGSCNAIKYLGATPVFIDSDYESWNMSADALERAYLKYPNPKAVIIVNLYGQPADFDKLLPIIRSHGTPVLEDSAESLGSEYHGVQTGNFGDISIFSFNGNKIITTSGGGMAMVNSPQIAEKLLFWATQSRENFPWYEHKEVGYNYRLSNICAGIGRGQLEFLPLRVKLKRRINEIYAREFSNYEQLTLMPELNNCNTNHWLTVATLEKRCRTSFMDIIHALGEENIESRPAWKPMHRQPVFAETDFFTAVSGKAVCEDLFERGICLPSDTKMSEEQVCFVADIIKKTLRR